MSVKVLSIPVKNPRAFLPENLKIDSWKKLEPFFSELKERPVNSVNEIKKWLLDRSELDAILSEELGRRYIRMTCNTTCEEYTNAYNFFISEIEPHVAPFRNDFNKKIISSPFLSKLDQEKYFIYLRSIKNEMEIFRKENIPLHTEIQTESQKYGAITSLMTVSIEGEEVTLQKAVSYLKSPDRQKRHKIYDKINERKRKDKNTLNELYNRLIELRDKVATNAGFKNFRDYSFAYLGRFDYSIQDCYNFHNSILSEVVPAVKNIDRKRKNSLDIDKLKPWDTEVDITGKASLKPFEDAEDLINKTIQCFYKIRPYYGECIEIMKEMKHLDLESRKGKSPGGYNYPLYEIGVPFIFMNAVGVHRDLVTMVHEGGHAIHSFLSRNLELTGFKDIPSEVAELASMSMELISMEHWDVFFKNENDLKRARQEQLEKVLKGLPWIAAVDKFQHWIYENPEHTEEQRTDCWNKIMKDFGSRVVDWTGYEETLGRSWQGQLHIFEIPFYYIEYGMAQLGAIAIWRNYRKNSEKALNDYENALKLGYTKSISDIYKTAGIKFDFSSEYVRELIHFVRTEMDKI